MGLALQDSTASLAQLSDHRHLRPAPGRQKPSSLRVSRAKAQDWRLRYEAANALEIPSPRHMRPRQISNLAACYRASAGYRGFLRQRRTWSAETDEGRELARSGVPLPGDSKRGSRPPSLERQEAFRDAATAKGPSSSLSEDDAELYRLGLLYDDEHERGAGFGLDTIVHDEPAYVYNLNFRRQGRRGRKRKAAGGRKGEYELLKLPLELSFSALGDDEDIARFLISPGDEEIDDADQGDASGPAYPVATPLDIARELEGAPEHGQSAPLGSAASSSYSKELNILQPPDLISDFSDNDDGDNEWALLEQRGDACQLEEEEDMQMTDAGYTSQDERGREEEDGNPDAWIMLD